MDLENRLKFRPFLIAQRRLCRVPAAAFVVFGLLASGLIVGCGPGTIDGTEIEATPENLEIHDVVETYRRALEERDSEALVSLVSREYFENAGTTDSQDDDYGYEQLRDRVVPVLRDNIKKVRLDVRLVEIKVTGDRAMAEFEYFSRFLYTEGGKDGWISSNDFNRLEFVREDGDWRIMSGL